MRRASRWHQLKSANGISSRSHPRCVSKKISPGRLMHSSVTSDRARKGRMSFKVNSRDEAPSQRWTLSLVMGVEPIDRTEVQVARNENLDSIAVLFADRGWDVDCALEHLGHHIGRRRGVVDDRPTRAGLRGRLDSALNNRDQKRRTKPIQEETIDN